MLEIYLLIKVGSVIGALPTVGLVVFTAVLGAWLIRLQGFSTLARVRSTMERGGIPAVEMLEGAVLMVAGALLLTPGFFTDTLGFLCLIPPLRRKMIRWALSHLFMPGGGFGGPKGSGGGFSDHHQGPRTIEGEFHREDD